jgi:hypothetical protein
VVTPSKRNFLRVSAQMCNLDKQKTNACLENVISNQIIPPRKTYAKNKIHFLFHIYIRTFQLWNIAE